MSVSKAKAKAKPATTEVKKPSEVFYTAGPGSYTPRVEHNAVAYDKVVVALKKGKGKASHAELCAALKSHFVKEEQTHHDFIGYLQNRKTPALIRV